jgi:hypothetical protein
MKLNDKGKAQRESNKKKQLGAAVHELFDV